MTSISQYYINQLNSQITIPLNFFLSIITKILILVIFNYIFKGLYRKEHLLYPIPNGISKEEQDLFKELLESILGEEL